MHVTLSSLARPDDCSAATSRADYANPSRLAQFAIRTTIRNHNTLTRDTVIRQVAKLVGSPHSVDLENPDVFILVEVFKVGGSVVPRMDQRCACASAGGGQLRRPGRMQANDG